MKLIIPPQSNLCVKATSAHSGFSTMNLRNPTSTSGLQIHPMLQNSANPKIFLYPPPELHLKQAQPINCNNRRKKTRSNVEASVVDILRLMDGLHLSIPEDVYAYLIKECSDMQDADSGAQVHSHMNQNGHRQPTLILANRLLRMYVSCGRLDSAHELFDNMIIKDSISWATMIAGHVENSDYLEAITVFVRMQQEQREVVQEPTWGLIIACVLQACIHTCSLEFGKQVHGLILKMGIEDCGLFINFYGKLGCIRSARSIFDRMLWRDTVICTTMIVVYSKQGHFMEVLEVFLEMGRTGVKKNKFTMSSVIRACGRLGDMESGRQLHGNAIKIGLMEDEFVQCSLVDMYGKCGVVKDARRVFEYKKRRNSVCWNAMLTGYAQNGFCDEAIKFLYQMRSSGVQPSESLLNQMRKRRRPIRRSMMR